MPKKVPKSTKKSLEGLRESLSPDDLEKSILEDAKERRRS
jgi:hypothetical protein